MKLMYCGVLYLPAYELHEFDINQDETIFFKLNYN